MVRFFFYVKLQGGYKAMAKNFVDLSTAGIHVGYAIEATAGTKPTAFIDLPNPKSIPDFNPETATYDVTSLNDTKSSFLNKGRLVPPPGQWSQWDSLQR